VSFGWASRRVDIWIGEGCPAEAAKPRSGPSLTIRELRLGKPVVHLTTEGCQISSRHASSRVRKSFAPASSRR